MKKIGVFMGKIFLLFIVISTQLLSQEQSFLPYGYKPRNCEFFGEKIGYYICEAAVYKTLNGGKDWNLIYRLENNNSLRKTVFADERNFWMVTSNNLLNSKNGGLSFNTLSSLPGWVTDISFCDSVNGWALIDNHALYKTNNAGITWIPFYNAGFARDIQLISKDVGYISDYFRLKKTTNGGNNFYDIFSASSMIYFSFTSLDSGICSYWSSSNNKLFTTTNGGNSWVERETILNAGLLSLSYSRNIIGITGYHFSGGGPFLWISSNSGASWEKSAEKQFEKISIVNMDLMYGVDNNRLYRIVDQGKNFIEVPIIPPIKFSKIKGNGLIEWVIGSYYNPDSNKTTSYLLEKDSSYFFPRYYYIKREWENYQFSSLWLNQDSLAFIGGIDIASNIHFVLRSSDFGKSWEKIGINASGTINSFYHSGNGKYYAVGNYGTILRSTNDGLNWDPIDIETSLNLNSITGTENLILAAGDSGIIFRSIDGGISWEKVILNFSNNIKSLAVNDYSVWCVGSNGLIAVSSDTGLNWLYTQHIGYDYEFIKIDNYFGYIGGKNNLTLKAFWGWNRKPLDFNNWTIINEAWGTAVTDLQSYHNGKTEIYIIGDEGNLSGFIYPLYLPVEMTSFTAICNSNIVKLEWATSTEINNHGFEIHSRCGDYPWQTIGFKNGKGNSTELNNYSFSHDVSGFNNGEHISYRLRQIDYDGSFEYSKEIEIEIRLPGEFSLSQNYPNPFNPTTKIGYRISEFGFMSLKIYDVLGNEVATLINEEKSPGDYEVEFSASHLSSGVYFYQIKTGSFIQTNKMVLVR